MGDTIFSKNVILQPSSEIKSGYGIQTDGTKIYFNSSEILTGDNTEFTDIKVLGTSNLVVKYHSQRSKLELLFISL